jgi:hypothetical protein
LPALYFMRILAAIALALAIVATARPAAHDPITTKVTWSREIAPIVARRCAGCHRPDGVAPMSFTTYEETRPWLRSVRDAVISRRMPKWPAARGVGAFENDRSLSPFEIELIATWVNGGAPKGDARNLPRAAAASRLPKLDLRLRIPKRREPPSGERRTFSVSTSHARDRWITGWQFRANDRAILQAEFTLADGRHLGTWVPPEDVVSYPRDTGIALAARSAIQVTVWHRSASAQQDFPVGLPEREPELALAFASVPPAREIREVAAGCGETMSREAGEVLAVRPVAERANAAIGVAVRPLDGPPQALAWLREFDPAYQVTYRLRTPMAMPAGTRIEVVSDDPTCRADIQFATTRASRPEQTVR